VIANAKFKFSDTDFSYQSFLNLINTVSTATSNSINPARNAAAAMETHFMPILVLETVTTLEVHIVGLSSDNSFSTCCAKCTIPDILWLVEDPLKLTDAVKIHKMQQFKFIPRHLTAQCFRLFIIAITDF